MAAVFISHRSSDDALATQLEGWLRSSGFTDLFVDHTSITGGEKWADALRASTGACRVVICLVTESWLASAECAGEFIAAWLMGKRIIPLFLLGADARPADAAARLRRVMGEDQGIDITPFVGADGRLDFARDEARADLLRRGLRAAGALAGVGLDPHAFDVDRTVRPTPFPGLQSFGDNDADAALFFGRGREIAETLEELRAMRATGDQRPLVILGASGAGKSSLLKAGIIPRLRREAPAWIAVRAFRPGADPLLNFAEALARTLADFEVTGAHGALRRDLLQAWKGAVRGEDGAFTPKGLADLKSALDVQAERLRKAAARPEATILLCIDQAEELARAEGESGAALADILRVAMGPNSPWRLAFTIRTDSFPELQRHPRFQGLEARGYDLRALPVFRFNDVVEAPAKRYGVDVEPALIDALMADAPDQDALPLLAFATQRLWDQFAADGALKLEDYRAMGGLSGLIEDAAERALAGIEPEQRDAQRPSGGPRPTQIALGAKVFVPPLADVNEEGGAIRRVADWSDFDDDGKELLQRFDRWRLVVRKGADGGGTVEVAHEALFREWRRLRDDWLAPERARLEALRGLELAARSWERNGRKPVFLTHFAERLTDAVALTKLERYNAQLDPVIRDYLAASRVAEFQAQWRRRALQLAALVLGVSVVVGSLGYAFEFYLRRAWAQVRQTHPFVRSGDELAMLPPGREFQDCGRGFVCPKMIVIPGGTFVMGSPEGQGAADEHPRREAAIPPMAVGRYEVTHEEWEACVKFTNQNSLASSEGAAATWPRVGCGPASSTGYGRGTHPVNTASWHQAQGYVAWLNLMTVGDAMTGPYRLLTETEWEYAARAGTTTVYSWDGGIDRICDYANVANPATARRYSGAGIDDPIECEGDSFLQTAKVGHFLPNNFGLYDMHGNVWEWVQDCYRDNYSGAPASAAVETDREDTSVCTRRVIRGGGWLDDAEGHRSADRGQYEPETQSIDLGFRVARTF